ncbi:hypothetical protein FRC14_007305 [Serendipita sp. 396]|nr:hypothetical protein FRC14_007305 [Serendipita sp. 396]
MSRGGKRTIVCSHISSAFSQPTFYTVPPARVSRHGQQQQPSMHASQTLLSKIKNGAEGQDSTKNGGRTKSNSAGFSQSLEEHALQASITSLPLLGDMLLRITHSGYVLELTLLDWLDGSPVCWEFSERIVPMPAIVLSSADANQQTLVRGIHAAASSQGREADFIVKQAPESNAGFEIHCLWERSGESMYEYTALDIETTPQTSSRQSRSYSNSGDIRMDENDSSTSNEESDSEVVDDFEEVGWHLISYLSSSVTPGKAPTADSIDFLGSLDFTAPNIDATILQALFTPGPGGFSPYTISEALKVYVESARVSVKGDTRSSDPNVGLRNALSHQYTSLRARVGAIVGSVIKEKVSSKTGTNNRIMEDEEETKITTQRREWEGFLACCRAIEKSGHWPVALGIVGTRAPTGQSPQGGECVVIERERMGLVVNEDSPLEMYHRVMREMQETDFNDEEAGIHAVQPTHDWGSFLLRLALSLKSLLSPSSWAKVTDDLFSVIRNGISKNYDELLLDLGSELHLENLEADDWVFEQLDDIGKDNFSLGLDTISTLIRTTGVAEIADTVKQEDDEEEVGRMLLHANANSSLIAFGGVVGANALLGEADNHTQWSKSLTASYLSATLDARYDIASSVIFLLMFIIFSQRDDSPSPTAQVIDELFFGLRSSSLLRQIASRAVEGEVDGPVENTQLQNGASAAPVLARAIPTHMRAGTADSMSLQLSNLQVGVVQSSLIPPQARSQVFLPPSKSSAIPSLPSTMRGSGSSPLLQTLLPSLKRSFSLPYASDAFLYSNGIISSDSLLIACQAEVKFAEDLRKREHYRAAADVLDWLPKNDACCYIGGLLMLHWEEYEQASSLFEGASRSFGEFEFHLQYALSDQLLGPMAFRNKTLEKALASVLPPSLSSLNSLSAYYEHLAQLFEEKGQYQYSVPFYRLAIESADQEVETTDFWHNVFRGQIANEYFEQAYMSLAEMPDVTLRNTSVANLVTAMCERNKVEMLLGFDFVGFQDDVEEVLSFKARNAHPLQHPIYSKIYYSWSIKREDYRAAASMMYQRARILDQLDKPDVETRHVHLSFQLEAYTVAISALSLLDPQEAWISLPILLNSGAVPQEWRQANFGTFGPSDEVRDSEIVELSDMRKELELCRGRRQLVVQKMSIRGFVSDEDFEILPMEVVRRYAQIGMFEEALYSARVFEVDMSIIFTRMVDTCITLSKEGPGAFSQHESHWLTRERVVGWEGEVHQKGWRLLQESLERHDTPSTGWQYRKNCLERIMDTDRTSIPPSWLTAFFQEREPEYLIRTCLRYQLILPAIEYTILMIKKANQPFAQGATISVTQTHLPYSLIDAVVGAAQSKEELRKASLVKAEIAARIGRVGRWEWH